MLSKRYESIEVNLKTWLHVPSRLSGSPAVTVNKLLKSTKMCVMPKVFTIELDTHDIST